MFRLLSGCLKLILAPIMLAILVLALIGALASYFWISQRVFQAEPLVTEAPQLDLLRDKLLNYELKPVRQALAEKRRDSFDLKLNDAELSALVTQGLPPRLGQVRTGFNFKDDEVNMRLSRQWRGGKWINLEWRGAAKAEQGDFEVRVDELRAGNLSCPALALGQLSHLLEWVLETDPSLSRQPWRIPNFRIEGGKARLTVETWPGKK
jgi:hypothetical protein